MIFYDPLLGCPVCATPTPADRLNGQPWCCSIACYRTFRHIPQPQPPSCHDSVTMTCPDCQHTLEPTGPHCQHTDAPMSDCLPLIAIDQADAVELIELLEFVESWLAQGDPAITADFQRYVGSDSYPLIQLRTDLIAWAARFALAPGQPQ